MESVFPFVLLGLAVGLLIWGVSNLFVDDIIRQCYFHVVSAGAIASEEQPARTAKNPTFLRSPCWLVLDGPWYAKAIILV